MEGQIEIFWTEKAKQDLKNIYDYLTLEIEEENAFSVIHGLVKRTNQLSEFPSSGSLEPLLSHLKFPYRRLVEGNHKIIYRISGSTIYINCIFDTRQHPKKLKVK